MLKVKLFDYCRLLTALALRLSPAGGAPMENKDWLDPGITRLNK